MEEMVSNMTRVIRPGVAECEDVARPLPAADNTIIIAAALCLARVKSQLSCVCPLPLQSRVRSWLLLRCCWADVDWLSPDTRHSPHPAVVAVADVVYCCCSRVIIDIGKVLLLTSSKHQNLLLKVNCACLCQDITDTRLNNMRFVFVQDI